MLATTSGVLSPAALEALVHVIGADAALFAIDYPYENTNAAIAALERTVLPDADKRKIAHGNADRLLSRDRSQFYRDLCAPFYGVNRPGFDGSQGLRDSFWRLSMPVGFKAAYDCDEAFSQTDLTGDLKKIDVPVLLVHGDDDQIVSLDHASRLSAQLIGARRRPGLTPGGADRAWHQRDLPSAGPRRDCAGGAVSAPTAAARCVRNCPSSAAV